MSKKDANNVGSTQNSAYGLQNKDDYIYIHRKWSGNGWGLARIHLESPCGWSIRPKKQKSHHKISDRNHEKNF